MKRKKSMRRGTRRGTIERGNGVRGRRESEHEEEEEERE